MATISPIVPIPLPVNGVLADQSLRLIGSSGLADAYNWIYRNGRFVNRDGLVRKTTAQFKYGDPLVYERPMGITTYGTDIETQSVVVGTDKGWWVLNTDGSLTDITDRTDELTASLKTEQVVFRIIDCAAPGVSGTAPILIGVNGNDTAKYWAGDPDVDYDEVLDGADTIVAKSLISIFNRIVYLNVTVGGYNYPDGLVYTNYLTFNDWSATNTIRLADTPGYIVGGMEFGNMMAAIYKSDAIYLCSAIGQPNAPFRFDLKVANIAGPVSPLAIVPISSGMHIYLGKDGDVVMFDGANIRSLGPHIHAHFQKYMDFEKADMAFGFYDYARKELYFVFPPYNSTDCNNAVLINFTNPSMPTLWPLHYPVNFGAGRVVMLNQSKTIGGLAGTIGGLEGAIGDFGSYTPVPMLGTAIDTTVESHLYTTTGVDDNGTAIQHYLRTGWYDLGETTRWKTLKEIDHLFNRSDGQVVSVELCVSSSGENADLTTPQTITLNEGPYKTYHRSTGRLFALIYSGSCNDEVEWLGAEAAVKLRGRR